MMRDAVRQFVDNEIRPHREELEFGDLPPYDLLRKFYKTFGIDQMSADSFDARIAAEEAGDERPRNEGGGGGASLLPIIELCRCSPGIVTALGVSMSLTSAAIMSKGTIAQKKRWARDLLTLDKIGAWAITEPNSGSDAFGQMQSTARRDGDEYILNGSKTFITNGPYADTIVFICKLDEGNPPAERTVLQFVLDTGMPGLEQSKPLRKMGLHSSPTGMLFLDDVRAGRDRLLGESEDAFKGTGGREASKATFVIERSGVAAMALGMIERCLELSVKYAKERVQFGRPIGEFQLIQLKLARMEVARLNVENLVFRVLELGQAGKTMSLSEASAMKLYAAGAATEVALEAVQLFGGNGYMAEYEVEQLARDAKVLQIYAGTDEIQVGQIARGAAEVAIAGDDRHQEDGGDRGVEAEAGGDAVGIGECTREDRQHEADELDGRHDRAHTADAGRVQSDDARLQSEHEPGQREAVDEHAHDDHGNGRDRGGAQRRGEQQQRVHTHCAPARSGPAPARCDRGDDRARHPRDRHCGREGGRGAAVPFEIRDQKGGERVLQRAEDHRKEPAVPDARVPRIGRSARRGRLGSGWDGGGSGKRLSHTP